MISDRILGGDFENDTNAHVLTKHELKLQCKFVQKRLIINVFELGEASDMDTNAHMLEMRFRKLLLMMIM